MESMKRTRKDSASSCGEKLTTLWTKRLHDEENQDQSSTDSHDIHCGSETNNGDLNLLAAAAEHLKPVSVEHIPTMLNQSTFSCSSRIHKANSVLHEKYELPHSPPGEYDEDSLTHFTHSSHPAKKPRAAKRAPKKLYSGGSVCDTEDRVTWSPGLDQSPRSPDSGISESSEASEGHASRTGKAGMSLFPRPARGRCLADIVDTLAIRHKENYFVDWSKERVLQLPADQRPNVIPVTTDVKQDLVPKSVQSENKKLSFAWLTDDEWGAGFRQRVRAGQTRGLSEAKREAAALWRQHCPEYDSSRAVRLRDTSGNVVMKRTRTMVGSELEYRQQLKKTKVCAFVDQIWSKRSIIEELLHKNTDELRHEMNLMQEEVEDYIVPKETGALLADIIAYKLRKSILTVV